MAAIFATEETVAREVAPHANKLSIGALNGPAQTVISGAAPSVDAVCSVFTDRGVRCQRLPVSHAFHSPLVEPVLDAFENAARQTTFSPPALRLISNVTGCLADANDVTQPAYWRRHVRSAVRFADSMTTLAGLSPDVCLEVGPQATLLAFAEACFEPEAAKPTLVASLRKGRAEVDQLHDALSLLYVNGVQVNWRAVWSAAKPRHVELPTYPFQRERFWFQARSAGAATAGRDTGHPLLGVKLRSALRDVAQFEVALNTDSVPFLRDHQVQGRAILPATALVEMALAASRAVWGGARLVRDVVIAEPLVVADGETRIVQLIVDRTNADAEFEIFSNVSDATSGEWQRHVEGRFGPAPAPASQESIRDIEARCPESVEPAQHYEQLALRGLAFGPSLQGIRHIRRGRGEAIGTVELPDASVSGGGNYVVHPALLDACLQVMNSAIATSASHDVTAGRAYLPLAIESIAVFRTPAASVRSHARVEQPASGRVDTLTGEVTVFDQHGLVARISGMTLRAAEDRSAADAAPLYEVAWERKASEDVAWMPPPVELAARAGPSLGPLLHEHGVDAYQAAFVDLETLSTEWIRRAFVELGWLPQPGERVASGALATKLGVIPRLHRLVERFMQILAEDGLLVREGAEWRVERVLDDPAPDAQAAALLRRHPSPDARMTLAMNCGPHLAGVLRGDVDPLQLLFPGGSTERAESLYRDTPEAKAFNQLMLEAVRAAISALPSTGRLRVLEVGAGTGGTTSWVAPSLPADRTRYLFTDIGQFMVTRAREKFAAHGFMDFQTLDLEQETAEQGLDRDRFDLILASNVIHATSDLQQTLRRLRGLLASGGTLLMLEVAGPERWIDITFGLTEGWWLFTDTRLRNDYPLLSRDRWLDVLEGAGFEATAIGAPDPRSRQTLLAARKPVPSVARRRSEGRWLVLADAGGVGEALAGELRSNGQGVTLLYSRDFASGSADAVRAAVASQCPDARGVVYLWGLDLANGGGGEAPPSTRQRTALGFLLPVVQAIGATSHAAGRTPELWIGTVGAQPAGGLERLHVDQAALWGAGKAVALEHPELRPTRIDLDPGLDPAGKAAALFARLNATDNEPEMALRAGTVLVPRLVRLGASTPNASANGVRLEKASTGVFDDMTLQPLVRRPPAAGEVEIRVVASGVNFRDVMNAMAMRDDPEPLGGECAGRVVATGEGVRGLAVGDHVVAIAEASCGTYATTDQRNVARIPAGLTFAEAATVPFAFMTAHYALTRLGGLRAGETVLVHAGAGGVGTAAIQLAQRAGAVIIATAGSEAKRAFLRSLGIGHVLNSRTLDFVDAIANITKGRGVDVVLNSLSGDFIAASIAALAADGRFLEIGKRDIWSPERFTAERPRARYYAIDLAAQRHTDPEASFALFAEIVAMLERDEIRALPMQSFPLERAAKAFRFMAQARHIGKIVLVQHDAERASLDRLDADATYLITGGLSGLGLLTAAHLVERGARHLVLMGRRAPPEEAQAVLAAMRAKGAQVVTTQGDVSQREDVERVIASIPQATHPLRGVVHAAGTLADGALMQQSWNRFAVPLGPKVDGTWALHDLTCGLRLDFFVMYSSVASVLGSPGQANHSAANAFMDALAVERRAQGLPALSISWGAWGEIGAAADRKVDEKLATRGIDAIAPGRGLELLDALMRTQAAHACVFPARWQQFLSRPGFAAPPFFDRIRTASREVPRPVLRSTPPAAPSILLAALADATPLRRLRLLLDFVSDHVARVIGATSAQSIEPRQPLNEIGLDSLMAVELRNRLGTALALTRSLPATLVFDFPTPELLAQYLDREVVPPSNAAGEATLAAVGAGTATGASARDAIGAMSDEEIDRLYAQKMGSS